MKMVTVYNSFNPTDAQLIRARLEAGNFQAMIKGELSALSMEGYSMATGGIDVQVPEEQATAARELIESLQSPEE